MLNCFILIAWISSGQGRQPGQVFNTLEKVWVFNPTYFNVAAMSKSPGQPEQLIPLGAFLVKHWKHAQELRPRRTFSLQSKICLLCLVWTDGNCVITSWSASCCRSFCLCSILIFSAGCIKVWSQQENHRWWGRATSHWEPGGASVKVEIQQTGCFPLAWASCRNKIQLLQPEDK